MLIVSKFHDFYDSAIGFGGVDSTVVYHRKELDQRKERKRYPDHWQASSSDDIKADMNAYVIGFCGQLFPCVEVIMHRKDKWGQQVCDAPIYRYSHTSLISELTKQGIAVNDKKSLYRSRYFGQIHDHLTSEEYFVENKSNSDLLAAFALHKVPVFYKCHGIDGLVLNPCLKTLGFQQVRDPFTAYQEIAGFLSGVIGMESRPMIELSDKSKIEKHGFFKWSFRREPGTKK